MRAAPLRQGLSCQPHPGVLTAQPAGCQIWEQAGSRGMGGPDCTRGISHHFLSQSRPAWASPQCAMLSTAPTVPHTPPKDDLALRSLSCHMGTLWITPGTTPGMHGPHATCPPTAPLPEPAAQTLLLSGRVPPSGHSRCGILFLIRWKPLRCLACWARRPRKSDLGPVAH